jgi:hypothetical protein
MLLGLLLGVCVVSGYEIERIANREGRIMNKGKLYDEVPFDDQRQAMTYQEVYITNERYKNDFVIWGKVKCLLCGNLFDASLEQFANLYPDSTSFYYVANIVLQYDWSLIIKGEYPHARYFSFTVANQLGGGQLGGGQFLRGDMIIPDPGSNNPFWANETRNVTNRNYTIYLIHGKAPDVIPPNTLYSETHLKDNRVHLSIRTYLVDEGYDGTGNVKLDEKEPKSGLPIVTLNVPGRNITGPELLNLLQAIKVGDPNGYQLEQWLTEISQAPDKINAPSLPIPEAQVFWNTNYSVSGLFIANYPEQRVIDFPPSTAGGFANNNDTKYLLIPYSFGFGEILVIQGRLPTHPFTRKGENTLPNEQPEVQYFSITTAAGPSFGASWDGVYDEQIPVNKYGDYIIVISWPWNKPSNAKRENGVVWLNPGNMEGNYVGARGWLGLTFIRFQNCNPSWKYSPELIPMPSIENPIPQDPIVMGPYYPTAMYMSKEEFEKLF